MSSANLEQQDIKHHNWLKLVTRQGFQHPMRVLYFTIAKINLFMTLLLNSLLLLSLVSIPPFLRTYVPIKVAESPIPSHTDVMADHAQRTNYGMNNVGIGTCLNVGA